MATAYGPATIRAALGTAILTAGMATLLGHYFRLFQGRRSIYKLIYTVPQSHLAATKQAIFAAGGGTYEDGKYTNTTFESTGVGVFTPSGDAAPAIGRVGAEERVEEVRVEVRCEGLQVTRESVKALLRSHPYETVGYEVFKAEDALMTISKTDAVGESKS